MFRTICATLLLITILFGAFPGTQPKAEAMDPVTIAILAPLAIKAAQIAAPYVKRGLVSGLQGMLKMGVNVVEILRLPIGVLGVTVGAPFGFFSSGLSNIVKGGIAPFKLIGNTLLLPVRFCGVGI